MDLANILNKPIMGVVTDVLVGSSSLSNQIEDFETSITIFRKLKTKKNLDDIKDSLNHLFKESKCLNVIYTENIDKMFFGINIFPVIQRNEVFNIITDSDKDFIVKEYYLEIDSKLLDSTLNDREVTACILFNVSNMVLDSEPIKKTRHMIDMYLTSTNSILRRTENPHYLELLCFAIKDCMIKLTSIFDNPDKADKDEFMNAYGFEIPLQNAIIKLKGETKLSFMDHTYETPVVVLAWVLRLYNSIKKFRIAARHTIEKAIKFTGSELTKKELKIIYNRLDRIDDYTASFNEGFISDALDEFKSNGIKGYEDDLYEIKFEANHIESQDQALTLIGRINSRIAVIADYLSTQKNLSASQRTKYTKLLEEYNALRVKIANERVYENKNRLYVNYGFDD